jgi:hypothetical protein
MLLDNSPAQSCTDSGAGDVGNDHDFSHLRLYGGKGRTQVPQPAMLLFSGLGLLSLGWRAARKRRSAASAV